jgi:phosphoglycolate phosphatase
VRITAVLFDLDGTLVDTAPDMGGALNELRAEHSLEPLAAAQIRPWVSHGAAALVRLGFGEMEPDGFELRRRRFLELYSRRVARASPLFDGGSELLAALEAAGVPWGVVTNKPGWLTRPLLDALGLTRRAASIVSGDTLAEKKPHPQPLLFAASQIGLPPQQFAYVGDAERDMQAAAAAGMLGITAGYGYLGNDESIAHWPRATTIDSLAALLPWLLAHGLQSAAPQRSAS